MLTQEDRDLIAGIGFPLGPRPDLHLVADDGPVTFTLKGHQFYKALLGRLGLLHRLPMVKTRSDLYALKHEGLKILAAAAEQEVIGALARREIPAQRVDVVTESVYGTPDTFLAACERLDACRAAGENVIPVSFKRNS